MSTERFTPMPPGDDPLRGAYGLAWYERKPPSLTPEEWAALDAAVGAGRVHGWEYFDWKANVR
jgi:hypothetical protein